MPVPSVAVDDVDALAQSLRECGACRIEGLPAKTSTIGLRDELRSLQSASVLMPAAIGHHGLHAHHAGIRLRPTLPSPVRRLALDAGTGAERVDAARAISSIEALGVKGSGMIGLGAPVYRAP